jgi:HlyD family secretion protein
LTTARRRWLLAATALAIVSLGMVVWRTLRSGGTPVPVARVATGSLESWISTNGTIEPTDPRIVRARVAAFVTAVSVVEGQTVKRNDPLLMLDLAEQRAEIARAREEVAKTENELRLDEQGGPAGRRAQLAADLKKADVEVAHLRQEHETLARLVAKQSVTRAELDQTDLALSRAEATRDALVKQQQELTRDTATSIEVHRLAVRRSRDALRVVEAQAATATVATPIDGTVYSLGVRPGTRVEVGAQLATVADLRSVQLRAFVDEAELASVRVGQPVEVLWNAVPGRAWTGRIERLPKSITARGERRVGEVVCSLTNEDQRLLPNLDVDVRIQLAASPSALMAPRAAVRSDENGRFVFVVRDRVMHRQRVEVGIANPTSYAIVSGLREGDLVALPNGLDFREGMSVDVEPASPPEQ